MGGIVDAFAVQRHPVGDKRHEPVVPDGHAIGRAAQQGGWSLERTLRAGFQRLGIEPDNRVGRDPAIPRDRRDRRLNVPDPWTQTSTGTSASGWPDAVRTMPTTRPGRPSLRTSSFPGRRRAATCAGRLRVRRPGSTRAPCFEGDRAALPHPWRPWSPSAARATHQERSIAARGRLSPERMRSEAKSRDGPVIRPDGR